MLKDSVGPYSQSMTTSSEVRAVRGDRRRQTRQARYREIEQYLRELVASAKPGDRLPSEAQLCARFGVSRMTVRQALGELERDGSIERSQGRGTTVAVRPMHRVAGVFLSFSEEMGRRGLKPSSRLISATFDQPRPVEIADLRLRQGDRVVRIVRVRLADGVPVALEDAALPERYAFVLEADLTTGSLHKALEQRGTVASRATGTIHARLARSSEVSLLDLPPSAALLVETRLLFDQNGLPFERTETRYVADRYVIDVVHTHP